MPAVSTPRFRKSHHDADQSPRCLENHDAAKATTMPQQAQSPLQMTGASPTVDGGGGRQDGPALLLLGMIVVDDPRALWNAHGNNRPTTTPPPHNRHDRICGPAGL